MTVLDNIESVKELLRGAQRIFVLTGAGVSAESGVPTFRGGGGAPVWRGMPFEQLSSAQMVEQDLPLVWEWFDYRRNLVGKCEPNAAHTELAKVQHSGRFDEFSLVTQNIDGLHQAAGAKNVIELHGSLWQARCLSCQNKQSLREFSAEMRPPVCSQCFESMRPDVILFGEAMPMEAVYKAQEAAENCDICIVIGTSALVYPAAELPLIAKRAGAKIIEINPEATSLTNQADVSLRGKAAEILPLIFSTGMNWSGGENSMPDDSPVSSIEGGEKAESGNLNNNNDAEENASTGAENQFVSQPSAAKSGFMTSETHPLRVDFVVSQDYPLLKKLGMTFAPGKKQSNAISGNWNRDLAADLARLRHYYQADLLVSLIEEGEIAELGISDFEDECRNHNIELLRFPLRDVSAPPSLKSFAGLIREIIKRLEQNKTVIIHCKGGLGRAGLTAACSIVAACDNKISGLDAIKMVRSARTGTVETKEQENFVSLFGEYWQLFKTGTADILQVQKTAVEPKEPSDKHFLIYWQERNVAVHEESGFPLDVVSSRQLKRAKAGDTLWLVTINQAGELVLAGRLRVGEIVDYQTAIRKLNDTSLWDGGFFALPNEGEAEFLRQINLSETALDLRFANSEADCFVLKDGKINPQQMQTMRELTQESAELLAGLWETEDEKTIVDFTDEFDEGEDWVELLEHFRQLVREQPGDAEAHYNLGVAFHENDLPEEANAAYHKAIELDPNYLGAYYNLGQNQLRSGEFDKSEQSFKTAIRLAPEFAPARFMLGVVYGELGDFEKAIAATKEGLQCDPDDPKAYFNIANFYFHLRDYEKASEWFEKSAEIEPNAPNTFYRLGKCYRESGDKEKEFAAYRKAAEIAPDFFDALFAMGTVYAHLTETAEGEQVPYFETGGELDLRDARVSFYIGLANLALDNFDEARASVADLRELDASIADQLLFFIDQFEQKNGKAAAVKKTQPKIKNAARQQRKPIEFHIDDKFFEAKNIPRMYQKALEYLVDARLIEKLSLPVSTGEKRYILAKEPVHPTGKSFLASVEYKGFFMEAHNNRAAAITQLKKLVDSLGCEFSQVFEFDTGMDDDPEPIDLDAEKLKKFQGCLLGGAVGDALGAAIEFDSIAHIRRKFGTQGLTDYAPAYGRVGAITDDTQMSLFTAEGLLRAETRGNHRGICNPLMVMYFAYLRWLETQGVRLRDKEIQFMVYDVQSWLRDLPELNSRRAPGNSCLSALESGRMGTIENPINNSKGCGGVMRVAPIGLAATDAFDLACQAAAITHGHPTGYLSAGVLALIIRQIIHGKSLSEAANYAVYDVLPKHNRHEETLAACDKAIKMARDASISPTPEIIETLGGGWIAEEALAIALYCSLRCENDFKKAILVAVNHSGDSDSTGAITGNILGALHGVGKIPEQWLAPLELKDAIAEIAEDLLIGFRTGDKWRDKYPVV